MWRKERIDNPNERSREGENGRKRENNYKMSPILFISTYRLQYYGATSRLSGQSVVYTNRAVFMEAKADIQPFSFLLLNRRISFAYAQSRMKPKRTDKLTSKGSFLPTCCLPATANLAVGKGGNNLLEPTGRTLLWLDQNCRLNEEISALSDYIKLASLLYPEL